MKTLVTLYLEVWIREAIDRDIEERKSKVKEPTKMTKKQADEILRLNGPGKAAKIFAEHSAALKNFKVNKRKSASLTRVVEDILAAHYGKKP